jgi:hypothetical protein
VKRSGRGLTDYLNICLEELGKTTKNLSQDSVPTEIQTRHLPNICQKVYRLRQLVRCYHRVKPVVFIPSSISEGNIYSSMSNNPSWRTESRNVKCLHLRNVNSFLQLHNTRMLLSCDCVNLHFMSFSDRR